jgi:DNA primase
MARIPEEELERIKRETDLVALVRSRGIELKRHGSKDYAGCCPFHGDKDPSFIVSPAKGLFHCMGCGAAGNAIQFVERIDGLSFRHAFELLAEGSATVFTQKPKRLENPFDPEASDAELMAQVVDYYHECLLKSPDALAYLERRGLNDEAMIKRFRLGFGDRSLGLRLPEKNRQAGKQIRERLQKLGLLRESGHEHFNGSVTVPIMDAAGFVSEIYGRKVTQRLRKGTPLHLYLAGPHMGIWNGEALETYSSLILCEAPIDALTFYQNGFKNVSFIYGTQGFTDELFEALQRRNIRSVRLAYDADDAGNRAAERDAQRLASVGLEVYRCRLPLGLDVNEYALTFKEPVGALHGLIRAAEWVAGSSRASALAPLHSLAAERVAPLEPEKAADKKSDLADDVPSLIAQADYYFLQLGSREYRVGGLEKNNSLDVLKVALRVRHGEDFHLDTIDLAKDNDRRRFIERAHEETRLEKVLIKRDLGRLLLALEEAQQARLNEALSKEAPAFAMTCDEKTDALTFLKAPNLIERIEEAFEQCGLVGEESNRLAAYLACTSRKLGRPLAVIIQSTSAAGKSTLMESVLAMFPTEEQVKYSAMTGQSLYYLGETNLKHRILAIVEEEGAEKASYALKLLQSEGELTIASTGKDPNTGRMETQEYHVEGPVMIFLTTTSIDIDEELQNRCLTLTVDESRAQTERIHHLQRQARTLEGLQLKKERKQVLDCMRNVQRLIEPIDIVNPYAHQLTFTAERTRTRRDHEKYLTLIDTIALLHQHQRPRRRLPCGGDYIEANLDDIRLANRLAPELFSRSLDELPPQSRLLLATIKACVKTRCAEEAVEPQEILFTRRTLREWSGWSEYQVRTHLDRLESLEYVARRWGSQGRRCAYELLVDPDAAETRCAIGLLDVESLAYMGTTPTSCTRKPASGNFEKLSPTSATRSSLVVCS